MRLYPRSYWTSVLPRPSGVEDYLGLPFFGEDGPTGVEFWVPADPVLYIYRNPIRVLSDMVKTATYGTGLTDIDFNYAVGQNTRGAYTIRGRGTKCNKSNKLKVLLLVGANERQTDVLKENVAAFSLTDLTPEPPTPGLAPGDANVHVFDLIEYLLYREVYEGWNDGVFGPFVERAVKKLQLEHDVPNMNGYWDQATYQAITDAQREYIHI